MANLTRAQRLIKEYPTLTAYELLEKGLTQEDYQKLIAENYQPEAASLPEKIKPPTTEKITPAVRSWKDIKAEQQAVKGSVKWAEVKAKPQVRPMPKTQEYKSPVKAPSSDQAVLWNKKLGKGTPMSRNHAMKMKRKYPSEYDVR